jgi:hypothetical protein
LKLIAGLFALAALTGTLESAVAGTISHTGTTVGPRGGLWNTSSSTSCADRSCRHQRTTTAPNGLQATKTSSGSCAAGVCNRSSFYRGYYGRTWTHRGTTTYSNGSP